MRSVQEGFNRKLIYTPSAQCICSCLRREVWAHIIQGVVENCHDDWRSDIAEELLLPLLCMCGCCDALYLATVMLIKPT